MSNPSPYWPSDDSDDADDSADERTTIVDRADAAVPAEPEHDDERTTIVERTAPPVLAPDDERTTIVERTAPPLLAVDDERTTIVERTAPPVPTVDDDERTTIVERTSPPVPTAADDDERTTIVDRTAPPSTDADDDDDRTIISASVPRPATGDDDHSETIIVARAHETAERPPVKSASRPAIVPGRRGRRRITLPPVEPGFGAEPVDAVGPGAIASYVPRTIAPVPVAVPAPPLGADATRAPAPSMPSVGKRSRTIGMVAVGGFALACVVSVVGLITIVVSILP